MFLCTKCYCDNVADDAKDYPFPESRGPCEICGVVDNCKDVPSFFDWPWKKKMDEKGGKK